MAPLSGLLGDGDSDVSEFGDALRIFDTDGVRQGVPGTSRVGRQAIQEMAAVEVPMSMVEAVPTSRLGSLLPLRSRGEREVVSMVRVITEGDLSVLSPISTNPPCSIRVCIADELRCDPEVEKAPLPLLPCGQSLL